MPHDPILHLLGLAKKAGRLEIGEEPVGAAARAHQARVLLLAADAAPNTVRRAAHFGEAGGALWLQMPFTKAELGEQLGRSSCAMLAVTDFGFAAALAEREDWDRDTWERELYTTLSHELTHHMEGRGGLHALDDQDAAELEQWRAEYAAEEDQD